MELVGRVYRILKLELRDHRVFTDYQGEMILELLRKSIIEAQAEEYGELIRDDA